MAIQGLQTTGPTGVGKGGTIGDPDSFPAFERPTNWRQGILMRFPNGHAPLVALTSVMKKKVTDDPQYQWWERELSDVRLTLAADVPADAAGSTTTLTLDASGPFGGGFQVKPGDLLRTEHEANGNYEVMLVTAVTSDTSIDVQRGVGGADLPPLAITVTGNANSPKLHLMGSRYDEGANTPQSIRYRPTKKYNYTQIFRDSLKASRTAMHTRLRTVDEVRDAKQQCLLYHSIRMEYGMWFGAREETTGVTGEITRTTEGIIQTVKREAPAQNVVDLAAENVDMARLEDLLLEAFRWGSQEKVGFCGNRALLVIQQIARYNSSLEITPTVKEFGMDVRRVFGPSGTLVLKTHPLFNQIQSDSNFDSLDSWVAILDMANISYRPLRNSDTQYLPDRQDNGVDGMTSEYLTECGLEVAHGKTHTIWKNLKSATADTP